MGYRCVTAVPRRLFASKVFILQKHLPGVWALTQQAGRAAHNLPCLGHLQAKAFKFWLGYAGKQKRQRLVLVRALAKRQQLLVQVAFACWMEYVAHRKLKSQLGDKQSLQVCRQSCRAAEHVLCSAE